ncbi:MAG: non-heme iron oxygenase ferredoxin subunit [Spirochaetia bacterium]|nr:non-heme iron oxygenase ferredoxin subunit [Spirochaetia bacterium]
MGFVKIATVDQIPEGRLLSVQTRLGRVALTRIGTEILAFQDVCTHDDGTLSGGCIEGDIVECPRHGAKFNIRSGEVLQMPATENIETFPVRTNGPDVEVDLS